MADKDKKPKVDPNKKPKGAFAQGFAKGYQATGKVTDPDSLRKGIKNKWKSMITPDSDPKQKEKEKTTEGLADKADMAERDHEVQMARADLYKIAKYAIELHDMMKKVTEAEGIEGWQQAKITKAADYMSSVFHSLDYDLRFNEPQEPTVEGKSPHKKGTKKYKAHMAAMHAESVNDPYKKGLMDKLHEAKQSVCKECGNPSYTTLPEEKQTGVDGKVCWKGYKRMGTKKKGGKTVDNCVKM